MNAQELIKHIAAYAATYHEDSKYWAKGGHEANSRYYLGKADAYAAAAEWLSLCVTEGTIK